MPSKEMMPFAPSPVRHSLEGPSDGKGTSGDGSSGMQPGHRSLELRRYIGRRRPEGTRSCELESLKMVCAFGAL